jgi:hypothetical protein
MTHRLETRLESASPRCRNHGYPGIEGGASRVAACRHRYDPETDGLLVGSRTGFLASSATTISPEPASAFAAAQEVGWPAMGAAELGRGRNVPHSLGRTGSAGGGFGGFPPAGGLGGKLGSEDRPVGGLPSSGAPRVAESRTRYAPPEVRPGGPGRVGKNSPKRWLPC